MEYIRRTYGVPAKRGMRVEYMSGRDYELMQGVIVGSKGARLRIRLDGDRCSGIYHPTYNLVYFAPTGRHSTTDQAFSYDAAISASQGGGEKGP
jgi:hypothetical protein